MYMNTWHMQLQMYTWIYVYDHVCLYSTETETPKMSGSGNPDKGQSSEEPSQSWDMTQTAGPGDQ